MLISLKKYIISRIESKNYDVIKGISKERMQRFLKQIFPKKTVNDLIRIGAKYDGGYLVPDNLSGINACYSPGVSDISEFEKDCINRGMKVYMADKSVNKPNLNEGGFHFIKKHIDTDEPEYYLWEIPNKDKNE